MWIEWRKDKVETTGELFVQEIEMKSTKAVLRSIADIPPLSNGDTFTSTNEH